MQRAEREYGDAQNELDKTASASGRLEALRNDLREQEDQKQSQEGQYQDNVNARDTTFAKMKAFQSQMKEIDERLRAAGSRLEKAEAAVQRAEEERSSALAAKNQAFESLDSTRKALERHSHLREAQQKRVLDFQEQAGQVGPRVQVDADETTSSLDQKLDKLHTEVKRSEQR